MNIKFKSLIIKIINYLNFDGFIIYLNEIFYVLGGKLGFVLYRRVEFEFG